MRDLILLGVTTGFFVLCALYINLCDRIIGPDPDENINTEGTGR
ncbi:MAG TPA: hypothetical protein PLV13_04575 [Ilumatobacteraceae bacterium]|nr:hypothetical protein [Ilumatobacteraceae bacterium]